MEISITEQYPGSGVNPSPYRVSKYRYKADVNIPRSGAQRDVQGKFLLAFNGGEHECVLGFLDVVREGKLNGFIGEEILGKLIG